MKTRLLAPLALAAVLALPGEAAAFCVYNALKDRTVSTVLMTLKVPPPAKLYAEGVAAGKESCCNPKNTECNPDNVPDLGNLSFEARVDAKGQPAKSGPGSIACGKATPDRRFPSGAEVQVPARGSLRFELNPLFDAKVKYGWENPPFMIKVMAPDNRLLASLPCPPRQDGKPGRIDFLN